MLEVEGIDVHYGPVQALRGVSLLVEEGEMVALVGSNGAGKTTTLRAISGLLAPSRGSIRLGGHEIGGLAAQKVVRLGMAHLPEGRELFSELTVTENLRLGHWSRRRDRARFSERLNRMFHLFPRLEERSSQQAGTLSGGEQQMLAVARALMIEPRLLLVDELSLGLAPIVVERMLELVDALKARHQTMVIVEQSLNVALEIADRAIFLEKGEVKFEGPARELLERDDLARAVFFGTEGG